MASHTATEADDDEADDENTITLRFRLGITIVKQEPADEDAPDPGVAEATEATEPPAEADDTGPAPDAAPRPRVADLRELFQRQAPRADGPQPEHQEEQQQEEQKQQLEDAQLASYESNVSERQSRAARDRERLQQGDTGPLEALDEELMAQLYEVEGVFSWLESGEHRELLFRHLELRSRAVRWYPEHAGAYFEERRRALSDLLALPDAVILLASFLRDETARLEEQLFAMPEKGRFVPQLFAPQADAGEAGGAPVELD